MLVIHGYPPRFSAGSEVYTQCLALGLEARGHSVAVFCRELNEFRPDYGVRAETDAIEPRVRVHVMNHARENARFRNTDVDAAFGAVLAEEQPDIVHFGHLSHLSTGLVGVAAAMGVPVAFTLHDYWLACPRGQFIHHALSGGEPYAPCSGQSDRKCATTCFTRFHTGVPAMQQSDEAWWEAWVAARMCETRRVRDSVGVFLSPSRRLTERLVSEFGLPADRTVYLDYGFDIGRLSGRTRPPLGSRGGATDEPVVFGYLGRHHPSKGLDLLMRAFSRLPPGSSRLRVFGHDVSGVSGALRALSEELGTSDSVEWCGGYANERLVADVFDRVDVVVVPSVWDENSPLVIHEAQQARVPVITADAGGMAEYVSDGVNGLTFRPRDVTSLEAAMRRVLNNPEEAAALGTRGYLHSADGNVMSLEEHCARVEHVYDDLLLSASR